MREAKKAMSKIRGKADMAELWLDHIRDLDVGKFLKNKPVPVICVCKRPDEKGVFKGSWNDIADILLSAIKHGADYIDLPSDMPKNLNKKCVQQSHIAHHKSQIIISYHDFKKTPSSEYMLKKSLEMRRIGADIVKISVTSKTLSDTLKIITLAKELEQRKIPHIVISMGKKGVLSRVLAPTIGGGIMFAPLSKGKGSAPGQLTVDELRSAWSYLEN